MTVSKSRYYCNVDDAFSQDGGGNVHCDLDVYSADIRTGEKQKLTEVKNKSFTSLFWQDRLQ